MIDVSLTRPQRSLTRVANFIADRLMNYQGRPVSVSLREIKDSTGIWPNSPMIEKIVRDYGIPETGWKVEQTPHGIRFS